MALVKELCMGVVHIIAGIDATAISPTRPPSPLALGKPSSETAPVLVHRSLSFTCCRGFATTAHAKRSVINGLALPMSRRRIIFHHLTFSFHVRQITVDTLNGVSSFLGPIASLSTSSTHMPLESSGSFSASGTTADKCAVPHKCAPALVLGCPFLLTSSFCFSIPVVT